MLPPLPDIIIEPIVRLALSEDLGRAGDVTTDAIAAPDQRARFVMRAREAGIIAGLDAAALAARLLDPSLLMRIETNEGALAARGDAVAVFEGFARSILTVERTALNFVGRLSGVATMTRRYVDAVAGTGAQIVCTRKTTPGLRALEKRAVRLGGGGPHRYGLDDTILIKDNHVAAAGGVAEAIARARAAAGHLMAIEVEVDSLEQLEIAIRHAPTAILLDNFSSDDLARATALVNRRIPLEASGGVRLDTVRKIAETGVDYISVGALTHSAPTLDVALDAH
ncbi:MAG: carboxylating nicotinate-nucleotide diphosphorylase [Alphaproteobacteria bacterium]|nr:carboxylating nicotinate-nucleotide diphosphorylase [Alphaproteobacteria bacterium]